MKPDKNEAVYGGAYFAKKLNHLTGLTGAYRSQNTAMNKGGSLAWFEA